MVTRALIYHEPYLSLRQLTNPAGKQRKKKKMMRINTNNFQTDFVLCYVLVSVEIQIKI